MKKALILSLVMLLGFAGAAAAQTTRPLQLALFNPIQLFPEADSISGVSLGLLYSSNDDVTGLSLNFGVNRAMGEEKGAQLAFVANWVEGLTYGLQAGFLNRAGNRFVGLQAGAVNIVAGDTTGLQWGFVNWNDGYVHGWQDAIFNYAGGRFIGFQSGLVNASKGQFSGAALGLVNYAEGSVTGFQGALFNHAGEMHGLQFGLVNCAKDLDGIQIGLINHNGNKQPFEYMVLVNWSF